MLTNGKVSDILITAHLAPTAGALLPQIPYFYIFFPYLKTVALIILNKTENHKDNLCLKTYSLILAILICYLNLQHFKKHKILDQVSTESALQGSDKYTHAS